MHYTWKRLVEQQCLALYLQLNLRIITLVWNLLSLCSIIATVSFIFGTQNTVKTIGQTVFEKTVLLP